MCAIEHRDVLSQVEMSEGSLLSLNHEHEAACEKFFRVKAEYSDLLAKPENDDFALDLDSRLACSLVDAGKYSEAIHLFQELFKSDNLEDKQRLQLFFGVALLRAGKPSEARSHLLDAMKGSDPKLAQSASDYLSGPEKNQ
jgi:tetratricopeptide (TPR) repeat protein